MITALLHDIGKLVLMHAYPGYPRRSTAAPAPPRSASRRSAANSASTTPSSVASSPAAGACRSTSPPSSSATTPTDADDEAAFVRLADMLAHYAQGCPVSPRPSCSRAPAPSASARPSCASVLYDLPYPSRPRRARSTRARSRGREVDVLKRLAAGNVYKQIAHELGSRPRTVRTHLHNIYGKLGAVDRAQAVLIATERGWL